MKSRKGFTLIELLVVVAIIALLISILLPSLARARELSKRTVCMANLKGIGNASHIYSNENDDLFPIAPHDTRSNNYVQAIGLKGSAAGGTPAMNDPFLSLGGDPASTTACLWILVSEGGTAPGSFHCPSSTDDRDLTERVSAFLDFTGWNTVSYGFQVPFGAGAVPGNRARPTNSIDPRIAVAADKGPFSGPGSQRGLSSSGQTGVGDATVTPTGGSCGVSYPQIPPPKPTDCYRPWNSPNHGGRGDGEGQNILFADAHAEWQRKPEGGAENDNIYTCGPTFPTDGMGAPPTGIDYPGLCNQTTTDGRNPAVDTLIYP